MVMAVDSSLSLNKRRRTAFNLTESKLEDIRQNLGRDVRVSESPSPNPFPSRIANEEEEVDDEFYDLTVDDYYGLLATRKEGFTREPELSRISKAVIRVLFPDKYILEVAFNPSEKLQSLFDLVKNVVSRPELPFYLYTTPPKQQITDLSQDFYSAGFVPGAIVYFAAYNSQQGSSIAAANSSPFLRDEIIS